MIFMDHHGLPVDQTGDGGDSAVRAGILAIVGDQRAQHINYETYETKLGWLTRHPYQVPWSNRFNYTRDQMLPFIAGLNALGKHDIVRRVFWARAKDFFFTQSRERDRKGSTKYMWPHEFYKDSNPSSETIKLEWSWKLRRFLPSDLKSNESGTIVVERKYFDFADPLMPNHIGALIIAARIRALYFLVPIFLLAHLAMIVLHSFSKHKEENQMMAECSIYGTKNIYHKLCKKKWRVNSYNYWKSKNEVEYHFLLTCWMDDLKGSGIE